MKALALQPTVVAPTGANSSLYIDAGAKRLTHGHPEAFISFHIDHTLDSMLRCATVAALLACGSSPFSAMVVDRRGDAGLTFLAVVVLHVRRLIVLCSTLSRRVRCSGERFTRRRPLTPQAPFTAGQRQSLAASVNHHPTFGQQQPRLTLGQIDFVTDAVGRDVDAVDAVREFTHEADQHRSDRDATGIPRKWLKPRSLVIYAIANGAYTSYARLSGMNAHQRCTANC